MTLGNMIILGIILVFDILYLFSFISIPDSDSTLGFLFLFVALVWEVINLVLSIIMIVYFYKADTGDCDDCTIIENQHNYLYVKNLDSL